LYGIAASIQVLGGHLLRNESAEHNLSLSAKVL